MEIIPLVSLRVGLVVRRTCKLRYIEDGLFIGVGRGLSPDWLICFKVVCFCCSWSSQLMNTFIGLALRNAYNQRTRKFFFWHVVSRFQCCIIDGVTPQIKLKLTFIFAILI